jgi:NADPH-dependent curcumin reductase CurA
LTSAHKFDIIKEYVDVAVDYKDQIKLEEVLRNHKFTCYFDNVGENLLDLVLKYI